MRLPSLSANSRTFVEDSISILYWLSRRKCGRVVQETPCRPVGRPFHPMMSSNPSKFSRVFLMSRVGNKLTMSSSTSIGSILMSPRSDRHGQHSGAACCMEHSALLHFMEDVPRSTHAVTDAGKWLIWVRVSQILSSASK